ncbi:MAG TPA: hypothetical protein VLB02_03050 [Candidatus Paceibacterota bacterium]|nr:hypothetical protein [Candidatus Paceibacterota bacterium]
MEPEKQQPPVAPNSTPEAAVPPAPAAPPHATLAHSYSEDLAKAMQTTDAAEVQELLSMAREKETVIKQAEEEKKTNWVFVLGTMLCFAVSGAVLWFIWDRFEQAQPVPIERVEQPVIFSQLAPIDTTTTDIRETVQHLRTTATLELNTPTVIPLITAAGEPLSPDEFLKFSEGAIPIGLREQTIALQLGAIATGTTVVPFVLLTGKDQEALTAQLRLAEPELLRGLYRALGIEISELMALFKTPFADDYVSNAPLRVLRKPGAEVPVFLYGFITNQSVVVTTDTAAFQQIYDAAITGR